MARERKQGTKEKQESKNTCPFAPGGRRGACVEPHEPLLLLAAFTRPVVFLIYFLSVQEFEAAAAVTLTKSNSKNSRRNDSNNKQSGSSLKGKCPFVRSFVFLSVCLFVFEAA